MPFDIDSLEEYIRTNVKEIRGAEHLARWAGCSVETLRKEFWRKEKRTLRDYVLEVRIETAKRLLVETDLPCKEICFEAGFGREDSGAKMFRRKVGMTMDRYRAMSRDGTTLERIRED